MVNIHLESWSVRKKDKVWHKDSTNLVRQRFWQEGGNHSQRGADPGWPGHRWAEAPHPCTAAPALPPGARPGGPEVSLLSSVALRLA